MRLNDLSAVRRDDGVLAGMCEFARGTATSLADFDLEDVSSEKLPLLFMLSAWIRFSGLDMVVACSALMALRRALLEVSRLDASSEPVPLLAGEPRTALIALATYLHGLIGRSSVSSQKSRQDVVQEALAVLQ